MSIEERLDILYQICEYITNSLKRLDSFEKNGLKDTIIYKKEILHLKKLINEQNRLLFLLNRASYKYNKEDFIRRCCFDSACFRFSDVFKTSSPYLDSDNSITNGFSENETKKDILNQIRTWLEISIDIRTLGFIELLKENEQPNVKDELSSLKYNGWFLNKKTEDVLIELDFNPTCDYIPNIDFSACKTATLYRDLLLEDFITKELEQEEINDITVRASVLSILSLMSNDALEETKNLIDDYEFLTMLNGKQISIGGI